MNLGIIQRLLGDRKEFPDSKIPAIELEQMRNQIQNNLEKTLSEIVPEHMRRYELKSSFHCSLGLSDNKYILFSDNNNRIEIPEYYISSDIKERIKDKSVINVELQIKPI